MQDIRRLALIGGAGALACRASVNRDSSCPISRLCAHGSTNSNKQNLTHNRPTSTNLKLRIELRMKLNGWAPGDPRTRHLSAKQENSGRVPLALCFF